MSLFSIGELILRFVCPAMVYMICVIVKYREQVSGKVVMLLLYDLFC